jgi:hypothetical protein
MTRVFLEAYIAVSQPEENPPAESLRDSPQAHFLPPDATFGKAKCRFAPSQVRHLGIFGFFLVTVANMQNMG